MPPPCVVMLCVVIDIPAVTETEANGDKEPKLEPKVTVPLTADIVKACEVDKESKPLLRLILPLVETKLAAVVLSKVSGVV